MPTFDDFIAALQHANKWGTVEVDFLGGGAHRLTDGDFIANAEFSLSIKLPNGPEVQSVLGVLGGQPIDLGGSETTPEGEQLNLIDALEAFGSEEDHGAGVLVSASEVTTDGEAGVVDGEGRKQLHAAPDTTPVT